MEDMFHIQVEDEIFGEDWLTWFATEILDAKYEKKDIVEVVNGLTHPNAHQKADLLWVLQEKDKMFDGTLGVYPYKRYILTLIQMPSLCILGYIQHLKSIWRLKKRNWPSCKNWCFSITTRGWMGIAFIYHTKKRWQSMLDQWLTSIEQSH